MKNQKAIIFDVDGTLLDMKDLIFKSYCDTFSAHKLGKITWKKLIPLMGYPLKECYASLTKKKNVEIFCKHHSEFQKKNIVIVKSFLNTQQVLKTLKEKNIKIAAFTSRSKETSINTLKKSGIFRYLDILLSREDVNCPKPDPEGILKIIKELKVARDNTYMVGDTATDIKTGKNAGIATIGAAYGFIGKNIFKSNPDYVIKDISEVINVVIKS